MNDPNDPTDQSSLEDWVGALVYCKIAKVRTVPFAPFEPNPDDIDCRVVGKVRSVFNDDKRGSGFLIQVFLLQRELPLGPFIMQVMQQNQLWVHLCHSGECSGDQFLVHTNKIVPIPEVPLTASWAKDAFPFSSELSEKLISCPYVSDIDGSDLDGSEMNYSHEDGSEKSLPLHTEDDEPPAPKQPVPKSDPVNAKSASKSVDPKESGSAQSSANKRGRGRKAKPKSASPPLEAAENDSTGHNESELRNALNVLSAMGASLKEGEQIESERVSALKTLLSHGLAPAAPVKAVARSPPPKKPVKKSKDVFPNLFTQAGDTSTAYPPAASSTQPHVEKSFFKPSPPDVGHPMGLFHSDDGSGKSTESVISPWQFIK